MGSRSIIRQKMSSRCLEVPCCPDCHRRYEEVKVQLEEAKIDLKLQEDKCRLNHIELNKAKFLKVCRDYPEDVVLEVQGLEILAHKIILADKSQVFRKMFGSGMLENQTGKVQMKGASHAVIDAVVNFCYTGEISFVDTVPPDEVLEVADMYDIQYLKNICESELCGKISIGNLPQLLKLSRTFAVRKLEKRAGEFFKEHFDELKDKVFESLETPTISKLVSVGSMPVENSGSESVVKKFLAACGLLFKAGVRLMSVKAPVAANCEEGTRREDKKSQEEKIKSHNSALSTLDAKIKFVDLCKQ